MKVYILFFVFGLAAANVWQRAAPAVQDAVESFMEGMGKSGSLRAAVDVPDAVELDEVEDDIKSEFGKALKDKLEKILQQIKDRVENGENVAKVLLEKVNKIKEKLKNFKEEAGKETEEFLKKLKQMVKKNLKELLEKYGFAKRNLDQEMDVIARSRFSEFVEKIKNKILESETIHKIRDYIRNFVTTNPEIQKVKDFLLELQEVDFRELLRTIFESHKNSFGDKDSSEKVNELLKNLDENIREKTKKLQGFFIKKWDLALQKLRSRFDAIKSLALEVIFNGKDISAEIGRKAIEFFQLYKDDLGSLWNQIIEIAKSHIGSF